MNISDALREMYKTLADAYVAIALSIPTVLAGIFLTGSLYYVLFVRKHLDDRSWSGWLSYLFPREMYTSTSAKIDIWVWIMNGLLFIPIFEVFVIIVGLVVGISCYDVIANVFGPMRSVTMAIWGVIVIQFLGFWLGQGIGQYVGHLAMHKVPMLWALHRAHHSAESANFFAFLRSHPLEHFLNGSTRVLGTVAGTGLAVYLTGGKLHAVTLTTIFWFNIAYVLIGFRSVDHLHIPVSYGRHLDVVLGSPVMHQLHHSAEFKHRDKNMGGAGYLFDWMFGTLYIPARGETWRWGLNDDELDAANPHQTLKKFYFEPLTTMANEIRSIRTRISTRADNKRREKSRDSNSRASGSRLASGCFVAKPISERPEAHLDR
jgi:sterol desaturase/sphingolipid hydroxylase (fatty acid hydroxylase superfamily)